MAFWQQAKNPPNSRPHTNHFLEILRFSSGYFPEVHAERLEHLAFNPRGVFITLSNIYDGAFCENS